VFARRASWDLTPNALARALALRRARGLGVLDLSDSNPTRCGLVRAGEALAAALAALAADPAARAYEPDPRGAAGAREAVAAYHGRAGAQVGLEQVVLAAGTSEAYAQLFRLLGDPGDCVHVPLPGYPLFEHLAGLEGLEAQGYPLRAPAAGARWRVDLAALEATLGPKSRAVLAIHPHNPTGSRVDPADLVALRELCAARGLALLCDEVFADYAEDGVPASTLAQGADGPLHFVLSGASKVLALPQLKVAWIVAAGPAALRDEALARLEFASDAFLSVSPLLACCLPALLARRGSIQDELRARVARNRAALAGALAGIPGAELLPAEAGWAAIVRARAARGAAPDEEDLALALLERAGVFVQPGHWFDLAAEVGGARCAHFVLSLLAAPERFAEGAAACAAALARALRV
jgi:aspartate/methionine/tyrosine aminotransferase